MSKRFLKKVGLIGGILFLLMVFLSGSALAQGKYGTQVSKKLYHVHTRVLWDVGWLTNDSLLDAGGFFSYWPTPKALVYGPDRTLFLSPLEGYGIPEVPVKTTRKVRLYVNYGHQEGCSGTPTVRIAGAHQVEFSLPIIGGFYGDMAAGWSDFKDLSEYQGMGHAVIQVYQKDGSGDCDPAGVVYKIEAHFYDDYNKQ